MSRAVSTDRRPLLARVWLELRLWAVLFFADFLLPLLALVAPLWDRDLFLVAVAFDFARLLFVFFFAGMRAVYHFQELASLSAPDTQVVALDISLSILDPAICPAGSAPLERIIRDATTALIIAR